MGLNKQEKVMKIKRAFNTVLSTKGLMSAMSATTLLTGQAIAVETKPHKVGATNVTAVVTASFGYGDNVFRGSEQETSSSFLSVRPVVEAVRETNEQVLKFGYEGDGIAFFDSSDDNYVSNKLSGDYSVRINSVSEFKLGAAYQDGSTIRGTDITEGTDGDVEGATDFSRSDFYLGYAVGSVKTGPSLELGYNFTDLEFDNFEIVNQGRDYQLNGLSARFGYQYSVATQFFIQLNYNDFDYDGVAFAFGNAELDNTEETALVGVRWRLNRLTSGEISVGVTDKEFDNFEDPSSFANWNVNVEWTPTPRDTISLNSFSRPFEQAGTGLFQEVEQTSISWARNLARNFSVSAGYSFGSVDFEDVVRDDDIDSVDLKLLYRPNQYSEWGLNYRYEDKESTLAQFDFDTNTILLSYAFSL